MDDDNRIDDMPQAEDTEQQGSGRIYQTRYDDFMYEPIGFGEPESPEPPQPPEKEKHRSGYGAAITLFFVFLLVSIIAAVAAIVFDVFNSKKAIEKIASQNVVLYSESKPEGANDIVNKVDEDGRYTPEGAAASVIDSIVEIYTYTDSSKDKLSSTGSGIVLSKDGYIVTNAHVLLENGCHVVKTNDGQTLEAKIVGRDIKTDIAVIKVSNAKTLYPATLGDSDETIVGEQVLAIGNPAGLSSTVTDGIVSYVNRPIRSNSTGFEMECIQTNAQISPGNSGGALVDMFGHVIGITSSKYVSSDLEGLGFAITINEAKPIIDELIDKGYVQGRFRVGIELIGMSNSTEIAAIEGELGYSLPEDFKGIYIGNISEDADIASTDLQIGDFITAINGKSVSSYSEFYDTVSSMYDAGDTVPATCAHVAKDGSITYYDIEFKLMEDTSGNY